ncbi:hypothetical protein [Rhodoblastus sp.]|uniref:hypothetical protein n=1 Tax=Rhodoblastus sp. TaxID=1962975 RepID=UPI003F96DFD8
MDHQSLGSSRLSSIFKPWKGQATWIARYWALYGGWWELIKSPYAQSSVVFGALCSICATPAFDPAATTISVVPNVLGFTVGALAIILAFSSADFFRYLTQKGKSDSLFMKTIANFVHFILIQIGALLLSIFSSAHSGIIWKFATVTMLTYAVLTTLSIVIQLFQMATVYNMSTKATSVKDGDDSEKIDER